MTHSCHLESRLDGPRWLSFHTMERKVTRKVLRIIHDEYSGGDRASQTLPERGVQLETICPRNGDLLPSVDDGFDGAIVYGGVQSANSAEKYICEELDWIERWVATDKPFLGLCLGGQMLAKALGATVSRHPDGLEEWGFYAVHPTTAGRAFMDDPMHVYAAHNEGFDLPVGGELLLSGTSFPNQAFRFGANAYGLQFHPECTPALMQTWLELSRDDIGKPGTHDEQRQLADSSRYDAAMGTWFEAFLDAWLAGAHTGPV